MKAELIIPKSADLHVVNAARVSFDKESSVFTYRKDLPKGSDEGLLQYLASHNHFTPFTHVRFTMNMGCVLDIATMSQESVAGAVWKLDSYGDILFRTSLWGWAALLRSDYFFYEEDYTRVAATLKARAPECARVLLPEKFADVDPYDHSIQVEDPYFIDVTMRETVPIFVARQRFKHMVGFTYNEVSRRYVDDAPEFFVPEVWRSRPDGSVKQGSGLSIVERIKSITGRNIAPKDDYSFLVRVAASLYLRMVEGKIAPEQARMVLPQSMYTSYYVTGSLAAWKRAYVQRTDAHAQQEIRDLAEQWNTNLKGYWPLEETGH